MNDNAVDIIREYIQEYLFEPSVSWDKTEFMKRSYARWAAYEIVNRIMDNPFDMILDTIDCFIAEMVIYVCCGKSRQSSFIFQTAIETAEDIALLFV